MTENGKYEMITKLDRLIFDANCGKNINEYYKNVLQDIREGIICDWPIIPEK